MQPSSSYQCKPVMTPTEAGKFFFGWAAHTSANRKCEGRYPFPIRCVSGREFVLLDEAMSCLQHAPVVCGAELLLEAAEVVDLPAAPRRV
jgi:hypothetical protein